MSTSEIATVLAWHDAVNDNDVETLLELSSDDIVLPTDDDDEDQGLDELREWATTSGVTLTPGRMYVHGGIVVVEGFNDVIGLDNLGVPAVAIMSNKITEPQVAKITRFAKALASGKVTLLFDADDAGDEGAKEALWLLAQRGLDARLGWSKAMLGGRFASRQPENLTANDWAQVLLPAITR